MPTVKAGNRTDLLLAKMVTVCLEANFPARPREAQLSAVKSCGRAHQAFRPGVVGHFVPFQRKGIIPRNQSNTVAPKQARPPSIHVATDNASRRQG